MRLVLTTISYPCQFCIHEGNFYVCHFGIKLGTNLIMIELPSNLLGYLDPDGVMGSLTLR